MTAVMVAAVFWVYENFIHDASAMFAKNTGMPAYQDAMHGSVRLGGWVTHRKHEASSSHSGAAAQEMSSGARAQEASLQLMPRIQDVNLPAMNMKKARRHWPSHAYCRAQDGWWAGEEH